jgi:hypothetical protein
MLLICTDDTPPTTKGAVEAVISIVRDPLITVAVLRLVALPLRKVLALVRVMFSVYVPAAKNILTWFVSAIVFAKVTALPMVL